MSTQTKERIISSDAFVLSEAHKLRTLYTLKKVIRYNHSREGELHTESVAEHIYAMHSLADYFLPIEDPEGKWDHAKVRRMIQYHDIDEIETGDILTAEKTQADIDYEKTATMHVLKQLPVSMQDFVTDTLTEYNNLQTNEAKFVKAIDKLEPVFHLFDSNGKALLLSMCATKKKHMDTKIPYFYHFDSIKRFCAVLTEHCDKEGFFYKEA